MMKSKLVFVIACLLYAAPAQLYAPDGNAPRPNWCTIACEGGTGLVGGVVGGYTGVFVGGIIGWLVDPPNDMDELTLGVAALMGAGGVAGISVGTATGTWAVGRARHQNGRWGPTFLGALAGTAVGAPVAYLGSQTALPLILIGALLPATGAVIGYNISRPSAEPGNSFLRRLDCPAVALVPSGRKQAPPSLDVRLLNVRF